MMKTYEDKLRAEGRVTTDMSVCPECSGPPVPAFAVVEREPGRWTCSRCYHEDLIAERNAIEAAEKAALPPWETDNGLWIKAQRTILQDQWRWTVMPDSPLTEEAQHTCMTFLKLLNTLTIDYTSPDDVVWPVEPILTGDDYATDA